MVAGAECLDVYIFPVAPASPRTAFTDDDPAGSPAVAQLLAGTCPADAALDRVNPGARYRATEEFFVAGNTATAAAGRDVVARCGLRDRRIHVAADDFADGVIEAGVTPTISRLARGQL